MSSYTSFPDREWYATSKRTEDGRAMWASRVCLSPETRKEVEAKLLEARKRRLAK